MAKTISKRLRRTLASLQHGSSCLPGLVVLTSIAVELPLGQDFARIASFGGQFLTWRVDRSSLVPLWGRRRSSEGPLHTTLSAAGRWWSRSLRSIAVSGARILCRIEAERVASALPLWASISSMNCVCPGDSALGVTFWRGSWPAAACAALHWHRLRHLPVDHRPPGPAVPRPRASVGNLLD